VACHVAKVAQSTTATWQKSCHFNVLVGPGTFFKQKKIYRDVFQTFFFTGTKIKTGPNYRDENHIFFFDKARVQRHKKGIEDSPTKLECLTDSGLCQVLIYILLKKGKKKN